MLETALKEFLDAVRRGELRRDLFLFELSLHRELFKMEICDEANLRGLMPIVMNSRHTLHFDNSQALLTVVHENVARRYMGIPFTAIHGLDDPRILARMTEDDAAVLRTRVRP